jgi:hypothetical protein
MQALRRAATAVAAGQALLRTHVAAVDPLAVTVDCTELFLVVDDAIEIPVVLHDGLEARDVNDAWLDVCTASLSCPCDRSRRR